MFCTTCGSELDESQRICVKCGAPNRGYVAGASKKLGSVSPRLSSAYTEDKTFSLTKLLIGVGAVIVVVIVIAIIGGSKPAPIEDEAQLASKPTIEDAANETDDGAINMQDTPPEGDIEAAPLEETNSVDITFYVAACNTKAPLYNAIIEIFEGTYTADELEGKSSDYSCGTHEDGYVTMEDMEPGEYTLRYSYAEYNKQVVNVNVEDDIFYKMILFQTVQGDNDAIVALTWDGDMDLDLCLFNSDTEEYINCGSYVDSAGSGLFMDNDGSFGGELIYVRGLYSQYAQSFYVVDTGAINEDRPSTMEQCHVTITVYTAAGKIYERTASASEDAALWYPGYIFDGDIYDIPVAEEYIYDLTDYGWARDMK